MFAFWRNQTGSQARRFVPQVERLETRETPAIIPVFPDTSPVYGPGGTELYGSVVNVAATPTRSTPFAQYPLLPEWTPALINHVRSIFARGEQLGNRPDVFLKIGDSNTITPAFLSMVGNKQVNYRDPSVAGPFTFLADTIDYYRRTIVDPSGANSFARTSTASRSGWSVPQALAALDGEVSALRPSVAFVMLGTNDVGYRNPALFRTQLTTLVQRLEARGVVPILFTIPDRLVSGGITEGLALQYNQVIADVASRNQVPLINFWAALQGLPNRGLSADLVHPSHDVEGSFRFTAEGLQSGFNMRNLMSVVTLNYIRAVVAPLADR